jgi:enoyl-CoA hydratase
MRLEYFVVDIKSGIATVTFERPPVNAQNRQSREELMWVFDGLSDRDEVRVIVFTAKGKVFSAGADIKERVSLVKEPGDYLRHNRLTRESFYSITDCSKPVIAAVNGAALGAGFGWMLSCDILLAAEEAYFSMPEIDVGLAGGAKILRRHFSQSKASTLFYTGRKISATELHRLGVLEACVPRSELMDTAYALASEIAAKSPLAIRQAKYSFNVVDEMPYREGYRFEQGITAGLSKTHDAKEAQAAFNEKRKPLFKGI